MYPLLKASQPVSLVTKGQVEQMERLIAEAGQRMGGAVNRYLTGASTLAPDRDRHEVLPTLILDATPEMLVCSEACFAPLAAVIPFDTPDDIPYLSAGSAFALGASIFTADTAKGRELAARIPAGTVSINDALAPTAHPATPFGGRGASGWGVTQGAEGLLAMTVPQVVSVRKGTFRPHFDEAINPDPATADILRGLLRWTHARGLRDKFRGLWQLIRGVRKKK
jgi:aldehyde dehydrogenase (NAD+)